MNTVSNKVDVLQNKIDNGYMFLGSKFSGSALNINYTNLKELYVEVLVQNNVDFVVPFHILIDTLNHGGSKNMFSGSYATSGNSYNTLMAAIRITADSISLPAVCQGGSDVTSQSTFYVWAK